jgi:transposase
MLTMDQIHDIRFRFYEKGENLSKIAEALKMDRKTVRKYIDMEDFNEPMPKPESEKQFCPKLDQFKSTIDEWLISDKNAPRKQRHTAKRIYQRLMNECEGFNCSYRLVTEYVSAKKKELALNRKDGFVPLVHYPGEAQVDFGTARFIENGREWEGKYLTMSFPYSNKGYSQLNYGENMECLLESLDTIFRHIGGVPKEIWFDNTSTIVTAIFKGGERKITERFERFREHYRFRAIFMNPDEGHEKGSVENKVGYSRRNFMVPVPNIQSLKDYNVQLLKACEEDAERNHYRLEDTIESLYQKDKAQLHALPTTPFELARYDSVTTNGWGKFTLNGCHEYSVSPAFANQQVILKFTSSHVIVMDTNYHEIVKHHRLYGEKKQCSMEWLPYLRYIARRPRSLRNSGIYEMMPNTMREYLGKCSNTELGKVLKTLVELTDRSGFDQALGTIDQAIQYSATDADSLKNLHRRLYNNIPELPPLAPQNGIPNIKQMPANLDAYDDFLKRGVEND